MEFKVGDICHEYGSLLIKEENGKYFWSIEANTFVHWQEIPTYLWDSLIKFNESTTQQSIKE